MSRFIRLGRWRRKGHTVGGGPRVEEKQCGDRSLSGASFTLAPNVGDTPLTGQTLLYLDCKRFLG